MVLRPSKNQGVWAFDDPATGLQREPFVNGIPEIIETTLANNGIPLDKAVKGFNMYFSAEPFPGCQATLSLLHPDCGGNWYLCEETGQKGWLCPALFKYFEDAPAKIYVKCEL
ncbi:MAG: hypothetical protein EBS89_09855 [Proteobacteria bacterium]|nr:hypothetical protein [Pseudomonadota bacterium]